jgi:outer membrane protein assembly factor BamB
MRVAGRPALATCTGLLATGVALAIALPSPDGSKSAPQVRGGRAKVAAAAAWAAPNQNLAGTRDAPGVAMNARAVGTLHRIWRFVLPEPQTYSGVIASTPLVLAGTVYVQTLNSNVYALSARTGRLEWARRFNQVSGGPNGLSAGYGRLYGVTNTAVFALSRSTGRVLWWRRLTIGPAVLDIAPAVADGLVIVGTSAQQPGTKGSLMALDAQSGRMLWRRGIISGSWAHPKLASGGGVWWTPTVDGSGGLWVGTANPLPWGGTPSLPNGGAYRGAARYTDSLLELGVRTGDLRWADQVTPHDERDYDFTLPPLLSRSGGRDLVIGAGKSGRVIAWNRVTRTRVWTAVVGRHLHDTGPLPAKPVTVCPGLLGGVLTPMAIAHSRVFVPVVDLCMLGSDVGYEPLGAVDPARGRGGLIALDAATGRRLWSRTLSSPDFGCATAAGDAVFTSTYTGRVYAFEQRTGRTLWTTQEPAGINGCPAVAGNLLVVPAGAEPSTMRTPNPVIDAYETAPDSD